MEGDTMNPEGGHDKRMPIPPASFSARLAQRLESSLTAQLQLLGLELVSIQVDAVPDDDLAEALTGSEISICIKARAICCNPR